MSSSTHLTAAELLAIVHGDVDDGSSIEHIENCIECFDAVEQLGAAGAERIDGLGIGHTAPGWLREAGLAALRELEDAVAHPSVRVLRTESDPPRTAHTSGAPASGKAAKFLTRGALLGFGALAVLGVVWSVQKHTGVDELKVSARGGGVSARLFCSARPSAVLGAVDTCPVGSELGVNASAPSNSRLTTVSVVGCQQTRVCQVVSSSRVAGRSTVVAGPSLEVPGLLDVVVVWSDVALDSDSLLSASRGLKHVAGVPQLELPVEWAQVGFAVQVVNKAPPP